MLVKKRAIPPICQIRSDHEGCVVILLFYAAFCAIFFLWIQSFPSTNLVMTMTSPVSPVTLTTVAGASVMVPMRTMIGIATVGKPNADMIKISAT